MNDFKIIAGTLLNILLVFTPMICILISLAIISGFIGFDVPGCKLMFGLLSVAAFGSCQLAWKRMEDILDKRVLP